MNIFKKLSISILSSILIVFTINNISTANQSFNYIEQYERIEKSTSGVDNYIANINKKNKSLTGKKVKDIIATITFSGPLSIDELSALIKESAIEVKQVQVRILVGNERITGSIKDMTKIKESVNKFIAETDKAVFIGCTDIYVKTDSDQISKLEKNKQILLIDTSGDNYFTGNSKDIYPHSLTWLIEDIKAGTLE